MSNAFLRRKEHNEVVSRATVQKQERGQDFAPKPKSFTLYPGNDDDLTFIARELSQLSRRNVGKSHVIRTAINYFMEKLQTDDPEFLDEMEHLIRVSR